MNTPVSLIATVRNEAGTISSFLASLLAQTRPPDEIVIVDGGSSDGTLGVLQALQRSHPALHVHAAPGCSIAQGRNLAIERAQGPIIAVTDAGTVVDPRWLEALVAPFEADPDLAVSAGFFRPGGRTLFERTLSAVITPQLPEIDPDRFLPSSRSVAFRKDWWAKAGGYPEWLRHCEDLIFDLALRDAGASQVFAPEAIVTWHARPSLRAFFRQYHNYARGDGHALLFGRRHLVRYGSYLAGALLLAASPHSRWARFALLAGMAGHLGRFHRRLLRFPPATGPAGLAAAHALVPVVVVTGDVAKMLGYPLGRWERWQAGGPEGLGRRRLAGTGASPGREGR